MTLTVDQLPYPTAILLDWDGTVNDSMAVLHAGHNEVRRHFGMDPVDYEYSRGLTMYESRIGQQMLLGDEAKVDEGLKIYTDFVVAHHLDYLGKDANGYFGVIPDVVAFLERARALNILLGIVTNKRRFVFDKEIERLGWQDWFKITVCANETVRNKPAGDPALLALKILAVEPSKNVWFIGDTGSDMLCAQEAGLTGIYMATEPPLADWPCNALLRYESLIKRLA